MRLTCPKCSTQYEVDARVIPEHGREVQCSNCGETWFQPPEGAELPEPVDATPDMAAAAEEPVEETPSHTGVEVDADDADLTADLPVSEEVDDEPDHEISEPVFAHTPQSIETPEFDEPESVAADDETQEAIAQVESMTFADGALEEEAFKSSAQFAATAVAAFDAQPEDEEEPVSEPYADPEAHQETEEFAEVSEPAWVSGADVFAFQETAEPEADTFESDVSDEAERDSADDPVEEVASAPEPTAIFEATEQDAHEDDTLDTVVADEEPEPAPEPPTDFLSRVQAKAAAAEPDQVEAEPEDTVNRIVPRRPKLSKSVRDILREEADFSRSKRGSDEPDISDPEPTPTEKALKSQDSLDFVDVDEDEDDARFRNTLSERIRAHLPQDDETTEEAATPSPAPEPKAEKRSARERVDVEALIANAAATANARNDVFPDIEEINSTLDASSEHYDADDDLEYAGHAPKKRKSFRVTLAVFIIIASLMVALYNTAPALARSVPQTSGFLEVYVDAANHFRIWMDGALTSASEQINSLVETLDS